MTHPTKAIIPLMLEDARKIEEREEKKNSGGMKSQYSNMQSQGMPGQETEVRNPYVFTIVEPGQQTLQKEKDPNMFEATKMSKEMISKCIRRCSTIQLHETKEICGIKLKTYYAGHVLGAVMFYIEYNGISVVYTGDYNMTADRHLGGAWIEPLKPDLWITETTYANSIRDPKRAREREFFKTIHKTLDDGGKVLIPVFALGRAQELCILLETYWSRTGIKYPIYFAGGLSERANFYYKLFTNWTNEKIKKSFVSEDKNLFEFKNVKNFEWHMINSNTPMVLFATPGMMNAGTSLAIFKEWWGDERNWIIIPGYWSPGSVGHKVLNMQKRLEIDKKFYNVKWKVMSMSFSAHVDSKGIMEFLTYLNPSNIVLVHGDNEGMLDLKRKITDILKIPWLNPENHSTTVIPIIKKIPFSVSLNLFNYYYTNSLLSESSFKLPNVIMSGGGMIKIQTSVEFVYQHFLKQKQKMKKYGIEEESKAPSRTSSSKRGLKKKESSFDENDKIEIYNKNTRYWRARVQINWHQNFKWNGDEQKLKNDLKDIIMSTKLTFIPDKNKVSSKLDGIISKYVKYEELPVKSSDDEWDNICIYVSYNILDKNIGELLTSSIKNLFIKMEKQYA